MGTEPLFPTVNRTTSPTVPARSPFGPFLVMFKYDHYCQGWEEVYETVLVHADSFQKAIVKIKFSGRWENPQDFRNLTVE